MRKLFFSTLLLLLLVLLSGCWDLAYYLNSATGHLQIISKRQSIQELLQQKTTSVDLQQRLQQISAIRDFASQRLFLPDNGSYRSYVKLDRPYVVWNVVATPEFSLTPLQWCFPIAGCVTYRGYFDQDDAREFARSLDSQHFDTAIVGAPAYSTLRWFDDPVLSTFSNWPLTSVAKLIFHELAHQQLYIPGDSVFNESFATAVEQIGIELWLQDNSNPKMTQSYRTQQQRQQQFNDLLIITRGELQKLFASTVPEDQMRTAKLAIFDNLRQSYQQLRESWQGFSGYDAWFNQVNNARFASIDTYHRWVPAFKVIFAQEKNQLPDFFRRCKTIAALPEQQRQLLLESFDNAARRQQNQANTPENS